jgi:hypothetical protein
VSTALRKPRKRPTSARAFQHFEYSFPQIRRVMDDKSQVRQPFDLVVLAMLNDASSNYLGCTIL